VLDDGSETGTKNPAGHIMCRPGISVGPKTHQGSSSNNVMIRNNIAIGIGLYNVDRKMTIDHHICLAITGPRTARPPACGPSQ
jgi:hypothetical protein